MGIKVKTTLKLKESVKKVKDSIRRESFDELIEAIKNVIRKGISPVEGAGRFTRYSESYRDAIKKGYEAVSDKQGKVSPVDMTLSGDMLRSLKLKPGDEGRVLEFEDEKADYHNNQGAGKAKTIRRLLPRENGEKFSNVVQNKFVKAVKDLVKKIRF